MGLVAVEVSLKGKYGVPEIWKAHEQVERAEAEANAFRGCGFRVVTIPGGVLRAVPESSPVRSVTLDAGAAHLRTDDGDVVISGETTVVVVEFSPRAGAPVDLREDQPEERGASGRKPFVDLFVGFPPVRVSVMPEVTDFGGLGEHQTSSAGTNLFRFLAEVKTRVPTALVDHRLANMGLRRRARDTAAQYLVFRRGYSYGTASLERLLASIQPDFDALSHCELATRLAYLTTLSRAAVSAT